MPEATPAPAQPAAEAPAAPAATPEASAPVDFQARAAALLKETPGPAAEAPKPAATPEGKPPLEAPAAPAKDEPFAAKFAQIAEASKRQRAEAEAQKAALREEREALRREQADLDLLRQAKASGSPVKFLMAGGWSYEDATAEVLGKLVPGKREAEAPAAKVDPEIAAMKQELQALKAERAAEQDRAAVATFKAGMVAHAQANKEKYELVDATDSYDDAVRLVTNYVAQHGELPAESPEAAMELALAHMEAKLEKQHLSERVLTASKVRSRLTPVVPKPAADRPQATSAKSPPSALTNSLAAAAPRAAKPEPRTPADFIAAAAAVIRGEDAG
jgi:hypothetical protein